MEFNVVSAVAREDYTLDLTFEDGKRGRFDMTPYLERRPWAPIRPLPRFLMASAIDGTVTWPGNIDMAPEILYENSLTINR
ncbi:MAG: DUF2442 domain-containing protein [Coriobacteriaceae bacterium]|nr:DUF2442 domain-containing protein [Coriobacteriaceae bacterium]